MPRRQLSLIQLVGYQRASHNRTCQAVFDSGVHIVGLFALIWTGYLVLEWAMRP